MDRTKNIHFIGIGGTGMSAIASVLLDMGFKVSGSDLQFNDFTDKLEKKGAIINKGHIGFNINNTSLVVVSSAIPKDNPELIEAKKNNLTIIQRADMLNQLMRHKKGIVVSGTHGKTTTTSMISLVLEKSKMDPTVIIGGELNDIGGNAKLGKSEYLVAEADESDGSFLKLHPYIGIITNVEDDHLDYYKNRENIISAFSEFASQVSPFGVLVLCGDSIDVEHVASKYPGLIITYGFNDTSDMKAVVRDLNHFGSISDIFWEGEHIGTLRLQVPGKHNILNALAAISVSMQLGISFSDISNILSFFQGASRRFQLLVDKESDVLIIDDYAHHPTEIMATLEAAKDGLQNGGKIITVFQPHRYTRTALLKEKFGKAFYNSDLLFLTEIYAAGESSIPGVSSELIYKELLKNGYDRVEYVPLKEGIPSLILDVVESGDIVLFMGAGDIWKQGYEFAKELKIERYAFA